MYTQKNMEMITDLSYEQFCAKYYSEAQKTADIIVANLVNKNGRFPASIDLKLVKDESIVKALEKTYKSYDPNHESNASVKTFLSHTLFNIITREITKEAKAVGVKLKVSLDNTYNEGGKAVAEDEEDSQTDDSDDSDDVGTQNDISEQEDDGDKSDVHSKLTSCIKRLGREDQIILACWMNNQKSYADDALHQLGWDQDKRGLVQTRKKRALETLRRMMEEAPKEKKPLETDPEEMPQDDQSERYVYDIKLEVMKPYVDLMKKYVGLNHPQLDWELMLLDKDPERLFQLTAFVPHEIIRKAFEESSFNPVGNSDVYISFLWMVANLYYDNSYQLYEDAIMEDEWDYLAWEATRKDIVMLYRFISNHQSSEPVSIRIGSDTLEVDNHFKWIQALLKNQLFPNCIPDITSVEQADKDLAKAKGRKTESKVATAIVNGIANFFKDEGLVNTRAPKNLCSFIRKLLIMMKLKDAGDKTFSDTIVKNWINNIQKQKGDPKIFTREIKRATIDDLKKVSPSEAGERWLYHPKRS